MDTPKTHPLAVRFPVYENQKSHFGNGIYIKSGRTYAHALFHAINITLKHYTCHWGVLGCFSSPGCHVNISPMPQAHMGARFISPLNVTLYVNSFTKYFKYTCLNTYIYFFSTKIYIYMKGSYFYMYVLSYKVGRRFLH